MGRRKTRRAEAGSVGAPEGEGGAQRTALFIRSTFRSFRSRSPRIPGPMEPSTTNDDALKRVLKEAIAETLHEQREWFQDVIAEVLEEMALDEALREVEAIERLKQPSSFGVVEGEA